MVTVCPICGFHTNVHPAVFGQTSYTCTNDDCQWSGTIGIEVSLEDYKNFREERKKEISDNTDIS